MISTFEYGLLYTVLYISLNLPLSNLSLGYQQMDRNIRNNITILLNIKEMKWIDRNLYRKQMYNTHLLEYTIQHNKFIEMCLYFKNCKK